MKRFAINLLLVLCSSVTVGLMPAEAGTAYIGPLTILQLNAMGGSF